MKKPLAILSLIILCTGLQARVPRVCAGIEWGADIQILSAHKYNYVSHEGYRVNEKWSGGDYNLNAYLLANISVNLGENFRLGVYGGIGGLTSGQTMVPLTLRASLFPKGMGEDGFLWFAEGGTGFHINKDYAPHQGPCGIVQLGGGYRYMLGNQSSIDFLVKTRTIFDKPLIKDPDGNGYVKDVRYSAGEYMAICFAIAINF